MPRSGSKKSGFLNIPARLLLKERDNATGSYPTILRMGDKDRLGNYTNKFDDTNTIFFGRRIRDNFELKDQDKFNGNLGYTKIINSKLWTHSRGLEIRSELYNVEGSVNQDGALVFTGPADGPGGRWLQTKEKIKNPTLNAEIIFGPYNKQRTPLKYGLGLSFPGTGEDRGLKIQVSTTGLAGSWTTIKTLTGDEDVLYTEYSSTSREDFNKLIQSRKRVKVKLGPTDFSSVGSSEFYLRFAQTTVENSAQSEWAIGYINIDYHNEDVRYPIMIDPASRVGNKVVSGAIATPHSLPTLTAPGRSISGISDIHIKFTPGENISSFDDARINITSEDFFFQQGSDPDILPGLTSPLWSKTQFVVDLSPNEETTFGLTTPSATVLTSSSETDDTIKQQLMVYWNNSLRRWEKIAQGVSGNPADSALEDMISSGALGFSGIDMVSTGSSGAYGDQVIVSPDILNSYARPTSTFGFPFEGKYHATASQHIKAKDLGITKPFILEKCQISFDSKFEFAQDLGDSEDAYSLQYSHPNGGNPSYRDVDSRQRIYIPTFFMLRQQDYDNFTKTIPYDRDRNGSVNPHSRNVSIPDYYNLSLSNVTQSYIETSRELITYGQITLYTSSSVGSPKFEIRDVLDNGLSRDAEIDILNVNGQNGQLTAAADVLPLTGSFVFNFPSRMTGKIDGGSRIRVKDGLGSIVGVWLDNQIGGRSYGSLDSSSRSIVNGTATLKPAGTYKTFATTSPVWDPITVNVATAESADIYSPYVILPEDNIIFGWQYPMTNMIYNRSPGNANTKFHSMTLFRNSRLTLFGAQLQDEKEFHETTNQNLGSDALHEIIGGEPVVDQFQISRAIENYGNYLDSFVAINLEDPLLRVGSPVQSRLTSEKGASGAATAYISFNDGLTLPFGKTYGFNDGDRISIKDAAGQVGHFYAFRNSPHYPLTPASAAPVAYDSNSDDYADNPNIVTELYSSWGAFIQNNLKTSYKQTPGGTARGPAHGFDYILPVGPDLNQYPGSGETFATTTDTRGAGDTANFIFAFKIAGGTNSGVSFSNVDRENTLTNLRSAINASSLLVTAGEVETGTAPLGSGTYERLSLSQDLGGTSGNTEVTIEYAYDLYAPLQNDYRVIKSNFTGGTDLLDASLGSFVRILPTEDATRIYTDSLILDSQIGYANSNFGTMQTSGSPIRPKYYLDTRKHGQIIHFLEQARDSKTIQNLKGETGLDNTTKGGAIQPTTIIRFVSGTVSDTTGVKSYKLSSPINSVNKTINSVLTGAFYDPTT